MYDIRKIQSEGCKERKIGGCPNREIKNYQEEGSNGSNLKTVGGGKKTRKGKEG